jgi:hypothetical protein
MSFRLTGIVSASSRALGLRKKITGAVEPLKRNSASAEELKKQLKEKS